MPVMVVGTGLGEEKANPVVCACAPKGVNHEEFFKECKPTRGHIVATDYGHIDILNDDPSGIIDWFSSISWVLVNIEEFFKDCKPTRDHMVATDYGRMDFLNDHLHYWPAFKRSVQEWKWSNGPNDYMLVGFLLLPYKLTWSVILQTSKALVDDISVAPTKLDLVVSNEA
ncbi:hypothetical protein NE237_013106 [Protea cynaroides]|uniref:Uncharacterized protein n=1 Tax=Protea cynaroides TaxID=273540 RepID=A0A9Q0GYP5_9MAGN|nr:hypothetical protein NE237_013106 [Protea cynaroides]